MNLLFQHFALILVAVVLINATIAHRRIPVFIAARGGDTAAAADAARFVWGAAAALIGMFLIDEALTVMTGASSPTCFIPTSHPRGALGYVAWALWAGWTIGVTLWILAGRGAEMVARNGPLFARTFQAGHKYEPRTIRLIALVWCVATLAGPLLMPSDRRTGRTCPASMSDAAP